MGEHPNVFQSVPVLDVLGGKVVRAKGGLRDQYQPIQGLGLDATAVGEVLDHLMAQAQSRVAYLADLDAIQGRQKQVEVIESALQKADELWLDAGFTSLDEASTWMARYPTLIPVLGTETLSELVSLKEAPVILSLDMGPEGRRGAGWWDRPDLWPSRLILMSLPRVGMHQGPDVEGLKALIASGFLGEVYAAGGVRHAEDLRVLKAIGVRGALVASMLYGARSS